MFSVKDPLPPSGLVINAQVRYLVNWYSVFQSSGSRWIYALCSNVSEKRSFHAQLLYCLSNMDVNVVTFKLTEQQKGYQSYCKSE